MRAARFVFFAVVSVCAVPALARSDAPEPWVPRPLITNEVVKSLFAPCPRITLTPTATPGTWTARDATRTAHVVAGDRCEIFEPKSGPPEATVAFALRIEDATTGEELATLSREVSEKGIRDCESARRQLRASLVGPNARMCTEALHPPPDVPLDLAAILQPVFSRAGPFVVDGDNALGWRVGAEQLLVTGSAVCARSTRDLEGIVGDRMNSYQVRLDFDVKNPAKKTRINSYKEHVTVLGISCEKAIDANRAKRITPAVEGIFARLQKLLPLTPPAASSDSASSSNSAPTPAPAAATPR